MHTPKSFHFPDCPSLLGESSEERALREASVIALVHDVFKTVVHHLDDEAARMLFSRVAAKKPIKPNGSTDPTGDRLLLAAYDNLLKQGATERHAARTIAKEARSENPDRFGSATEPSIAARVRKLVRARRSALEAKRASLRLVPASLISATKSLPSDK